MPTAPFPVDPHLTGLVIAYQNAMLIADAALPRMPVGKKEYTFWRFDFAQKTTPVNTLVGRTSRPNEVEFGSTEDTGSCYDHGLESPVPQDDIDHAAPGQNPVAEAAEDTMDLVLLGREKRVSDLLFAAANYPSGNKATLAGSDRWTDATSDPIDHIKTVKDALIMEPNILVLGQATASALQVHPAILQSWHGNEGGSGIAPLSYLAVLFELQAVLVGKAWINANKKGQTAANGRIWGPHAALYRLDSGGGPRRQRPTFGWTAQYGQRVANQRPDPDIGLRGGQRVRAGETLEEKITAAELGYLWTNAGDAS